MLQNTKILATAVSLGVGFLAPKMAEGAWKMVTGENPPDQDEKGRFLQVLVYAAVSAVIVTAVQRGVSLAMQKLEAKEEEKTKHAA